MSFIGFKRDCITVIDNAGTRSLTGEPIWVVECNCGNQFESDLLNKRVRDCGCSCNFERRFVTLHEASRRYRHTYRLTEKWKVVYRALRERIRKRYREHEDYRKRCIEQDRKRRAANPEIRERDRKRHRANTELRRARRIELGIQSSRHVWLDREAYKKHRREYNRLWLRRRVTKTRGETEYVDHRKVKCPRRKDLTGRKIGRLTVIDYAGGNRWNVVCSCGKAYTVTTQSLNKNVVDRKCFDCYIKRPKHIEESIQREREYAREYYHEKIKQLSGQDKQSYMERRREKSRQYYQKNKQARNEKQRQRYQENKQAYNEKRYNQVATVTKS